jgi:hypothetical protein
MEVAPTCESCASIDAREWNRRGLLRPDQAFSWSWDRGGEPCGSMFVRTEVDAVVLIFRWRNAGDAEWKLVQQRVPIVWTMCHLGGRRPWFRCTAQSGGRYCGCRVAILYGAGEVFACRRCYGLAMRASKRVRNSVESAAPEKSGCVSVAAQTCSSLSLISRAGCIGRRIFASERAARQQTQLPLVAADSSDMP